MWNAFDLNQDNRVDKNEMRLVLKQLLGGERELDASEFEEVWGLIDIDGDSAWLQVNHLNLIFQTYWMLDFICCLCILSQSPAALDFCVFCRLVARAASRVCELD